MEQSNESPISDQFSQTELWMYRVAAWKQYMEQNRDKLAQYKLPECKDEPGN